MNNKQNLKKNLKNILPSLIACSLLLFSCAPAPKNTLPGKTKGTITSNLLEQQSTQQISDSPVADLLGEQLTIENYFLEIPIGWYFKEVNQTNMDGWIFTSHDPQIMLENGFNEWAGALWIVTPLPSGANPDEFRNNLQSQEYKNGDLEAMLMVSEKAGLFDLSEAEILLSATEITIWGDQPCLKMIGSLKIDTTSNLKLDTTIYMMVHNQNFITFYQFSDSIITDQLALTLTTSRESIGYSQ